MQYDVDPKKLVLYLGKKNGKGVDEIAEYLGCVRAQVVRTLYYGKTAGYLVNEDGKWKVRKTVSPKRLNKFIETDPKAIRAIERSRPIAHGEDNIHAVNISEPIKEQVSGEGQFSYGRKKSSEWSDAAALTLSDRLAEQRRRIDEGII